MSDKELRVTDRRLFTPEGELRDEYKDLEEAPAGPPAGEPGDAAGAADAAPAPPAESVPPDARPEAAAGRPSPTEPPPAAAGRADSSAAPPLDIPLSPGAYGQPSFYDLLGLLAEPVALYLGDAELPDGGSAENLDMARLLHRSARRPAQQDGRQPRARRSRRPWTTCSTGCACAMSRSRGDREPAPVAPAAPDGAGGRPRRLRSL